MPSLTKYERGLCYAYLALGIVYGLWAFFDQGATRAVILMDFTYAATNLQLAINTQSVAPIWNNAAAQAVPTAVLGQALLLSQTIAHLLGRAQWLHPRSLWRWIMIHSLFVTHLAAYQLGRDSRLVVLYENWFWIATALLYSAILFAAFHAWIGRRTPSDSHQPE